MHIIIIIFQKLLNKEKEREKKIKKFTKEDKNPWPKKLFRACGSRVIEVDWFIYQHVIPIYHHKLTLQQVQEL